MKIYGKGQPVFIDGADALENTFSELLLTWRDVDKILAAALPDGLTLNAGDTVLYSCEVNGTSSVFTFYGRHPKDTAVYYGKRVILAAGNGTYSAFVVVPESVFLTGTDDLPFMTVQRVSDLTGALLSLADKDFFALIDGNGVSDLNDYLPNKVEPFNLIFDTLQDPRQTTLHGSSFVLDPLVDKSLPLSLGGLAFTNSPSVLPGHPGLRYTMELRDGVWYIHQPDVNTVVNGIKTINGVAPVDGNINIVTKSSADNA